MAKALWAVLIAVFFYSSRSAPAKDDGKKGKQQKADDTIPQWVKYIWPIQSWSIPLTGDGKTSLLDSKISDTLADIGMKMFLHYEKEILPQELKLDPQFAAEFEEQDGSRVNLAFARWQKAVYGAKHKIDVDEMGWDGKRIPKFKEISYKWTQLYDSKEFKIFFDELVRLNKMYLNQAAGPGATSQWNDKKLRMFVWFEVYRFADAMPPRTHTGGLATGVFFAKYTTTEAGRQQLGFEDPRGINPPFGKTSWADMKEGKLEMMPAWTSHFMSPHLAETPNVVINFISWPPGGTADMDWEEDPHGQFIYEKTTKIKRPADSSKQAPGTGKEEL